MPPRKSSRTRTRIGGTSSSGRTGSTSWVVAVSSVATPPGTVRRVERYEVAVTAKRAGTSVEDLHHLVELGILRPDADGRFSEGDIRRVGVIHGLVAASVPLDLLASALRSGELSLDFVDDPSYSLFASFTDETFEELSARTGVPLHLLMAMREATGSAVPDPRESRSRRRNDDPRDHRVPVRPRVPSHHGGTQPGSATRSLSPASPRWSAVVFARIVSLSFARLFSRGRRCPPRSGSPGSQSPRSCASTTFVFVGCRVRPLADSPRPEPAPAPATPLQASGTGSRSRRRNAPSRTPIAPPGGPAGRGRCCSTAGSGPRLAARRRPGSIPPGRPGSFAFRNDSISDSTGPSATFSFRRVIRRS